MAEALTAEDNRHIAAVAALDLGSQGPCAALYSASGKRLAYSERSCSAQLSDRGRRVEYDCDAYIRACLECLAEIGQQRVAGTLGQHCKLKFGIAGQGSSFVLWRRSSGKLLSPIISWQDTRAADYLDNVPSELVARTGLKASAHYGASKLAWCLDHLPEVQQANREQDLAFGSIASYLVHLLSAGKAHLIGPGCAQRTLLWDLREANWSTALLRQFRVSSYMLPRSVDCCSERPLAELHLSSLSPLPVQLTALQRDQNASLFATSPNLSDARSSHDIYINLGTGAFIQRLSSVATAPDGLLLSPALQCAKQRLYSVEGTVNGAAGAFPWLEQQLGINITPQRLEVALIETETNAEGIFINALAGLGAPWWRSDIDARFIDTPTPEHKLRAWAESITFALAHLNTLISAAQSEQAEPERILASGGLANSDALCQLLADTLQLPLERLSDSETSLRGIAWLAAGRPSEWRDHLKPSSRFQPRPCTKLQRRYKIWLNAMNKTLSNQVAATCD